MTDEEDFGGEDLEVTCDFLLVNLGDSSLEIIQGHLRECQTCKAEVAECFAAYLEGVVHPYTDEIEFPPDIRTLQEFLKRWHWAKTSRNEGREFAEEDLLKKLQLKEVKDTIRRLHRRQGRAIFFAIRNPNAWLNPFWGNMESMYRQLHRLLGDRAFSEWFTDSDDKEVDIEKLLMWWKEKLGVKI
ncbi:hypothetical protein KW785_00895 [Candidatus Parcubacteria bacterium]|nr:hypothetical protein [Candidatus Parcubacteria bacterium]